MRLPKPVIGKFARINKKSYTFKPYIDSGYKNEGLWASVHTLVGSELHGLSLEYKPQFGVQFSQSIAIKMVFKRKQTLLQLWGFSLACYKWSGVYGPI